MCYNDYRTYIKVCEYLGKEPTGQFGEVYDHLTNIFDGLECVVESRYNRIVFQKQQEWLFEQDNKNGTLWCDYNQVWSFFEKDMGMENTETQDFIKMVVEEHLRCEVGTPMSLGAMRGR